MNRARSAVMAATVAAACLVGVTTIGASVVAQDDSEPATSEPPFTSSGTIELELVDQTFDLAPDADLELTYRVTGDLARVAELVPPTTTATTTTTTTTTAPTTTTTLPAEDAAEPAPASTTDVATTTSTEATATTTTTTTVPPPLVPLTIDVVNFEPIEEPGDLAGRLGPNPRSNLFPFEDVIDGVGILDARTIIDVEGPDVATLRISVETDVNPSESERLEFENDGLHPILVQLVVGEQVVARHGTVVERRSSDVTAPPPIDLSLIAAIDDPGPTADEDTLADAVDELDGLLDVAAAVDAPITLAIPPAVAATASADDDLRDDAAEILENEEVLAAPATPFDVSSAAAVDRVDAFERQLGAGEDDMRELFGVIPTRDLWLATEPLSADGARVLRTLGIRYLAMPADVYASTIATTATSLDPDDGDDDRDGDGDGDGDGELPQPDRFVELDLPNESTISVLIVDEEFGAAFEPDRTEEILAEQTPTEWALATVARWRLEQYEIVGLERRDRRSRLIATPGLASFDPTLLVALQDFADTTESIRFTTASDLASVTDAQERPEGSALPETAGPSLEERLDRIEIVGADLADTASLLPDDDERPAMWARQLDSFVSTAFSDETVGAQLDELSDEARRLRSGVVAPEPFTFTLTGREEQPINISVANTLDEPLSVLLRLSSPRLAFPDGDMEITLAADDVTVVEVPVQARSNGTSAVTVEILTPLAERPLIEPVRLTSRVNSLTGLGQLLTVGFVLILASWWLSSWRSKRRARDSVRAARAHPAAGDEPATDE